MLSRRIWYRNRELLRQLSNLGARVTSLIKPIEALGPKLLNAHATSKYLEENVSQEETNEKLLTSNSSIRKDLSRGSFFIDNDGNQILDLAMDKGTMPLGYNSKVLMESIYSKVQDMLWNDSRYSFGDAHTDFEDFLRGSILPAAPKGLTEVRFTDGTGSRANEAAIKVALLKFKETHEGELAGLDWENIASQDLSGSLDTLRGKVCVLGFNDGGENESTNSSLFESNDWPTVDFPEIKYPMRSHDHNNQREEYRSLTEVVDIITSRRDNGCPVGAIIIEPITSQNNLMATPNFYRGLRKIADENQIPFIVNETETGVGKTGRMWAHEHWYLDQRPDIITFGKSAQVSGFFTSSKMNPQDQDAYLSIDKEAKQKVIDFSKVLRHIGRRNILEKVTD